jgi:catechol 2,3-dioxygenase-like lactoylglutathione lyase family enzyme
MIGSFLQSAQQSFLVLNTMTQHITHIALVVDDYDRAIAFYTRQLGFELIEDTVLSPSKRWVLVRPAGGGQCSLLLAKAANDEQVSRIGNQTGGRVFLFLHTDDFWRDYNSMKDRGINFLSEPRAESYGTVVVFEDLYGNRWDLIGPGQS